MQHAAPRSARSTAASTTPHPLSSSHAPRMSCRANAAVEWIETNMGHGPVVKQKSMGASQWSSAHIYTTKACCLPLLRPHACQSCCTDCQRSQLVIFAPAFSPWPQDGSELFVKLAAGGRDESMFQGEAAGLMAMHGAVWCGAIFSAVVESRHLLLPCVYGTLAA